MQRRGPRSLQRQLRLDFGLAHRQIHLGSSRDQGGPVERKMAAFQRSAMRRHDFWEAIVIAMLAYSLGLATAAAICVNGR